MISSYAAAIKIYWYLTTLLSSRHGKLHFPMNFSTALR
jgi:hypothetical protein